MYKNFPLTVSERWQQEIAETIFDAVNQESDKLEMKRRQKQSEESEENCERFHSSNSVAVISPREARPYSLLLCSLFYFTCNMQRH